MARPAVPPAKRGKPSSGRKPAKPGPARRRMADTVGLVVLGGAVLFLAVTALPVCILLIVGMVPSIVAYVVDQTPRRTLTLTVAPLNLAGTAPYCVQLWYDGDTLHALSAYLDNVYIWAVMYLAASVGWLLHLGMPVLVRFILEQSIDRRKNRLLQIQKRLRAEWGNDVDTAGDVGRRGS